MQHVRRGKRADLFTHPVAHLGIQLWRRLFAVVQGDVGVDRLAFDVVRNADNRSFGNFRMRHQRRFNFRRAQTMAGNVQHVVHASGDPVITVFIPARAVAAEVHVFEGREVGLLEALVVAEQGTRLSRPGIDDHQVALGGPFLRIAFVIHQRRLHAEERTGGRTGFQLCGARHRGDHEATGFGLPPGVHHRALLVADLLPVPLPGFRVDRLAHGAEDAQGRAVGPFDGFIAFRHQRADRRWRGVENVDLMLINHLAHTRRGRPVRYAFKHQRRCAAGQRAVQQVAMTGDPAHVGGTPVDVAGMVVEDVFKGGGRINQIAAGGMQHAFRLTGGAGGIQDKQRIFRVHLFRLMLVARVFNQIAPPQVAPLVPVDFAARALEDNDVVDGFYVRVFQRFINVFLQRDTAPGAHALVSGDHQLRVRVNNAPGNRFRGEAAEDHGVDRADARAGQHSHGGFRHHWHVDRHHIAFFNALGQQHVGEAADVAMQFFIRDVFALRGIVAFPDNGRFVAAFSKMAVQAVRRQVQRAVFIPFNGDVARRERGVLYLLIRFDPVEDVTLFTPERVRAGNGLLVFLLVLLRAYQATVRNVCGNVVFVYLAHGFFSPCKMLIICRKNVNSRGFTSFV
ncbi:Uncharacterised protein [Enterobacter hormaechei]|nr:Uncharacterised protein [Enterobacter hormaechei]